MGPTPTPSPCALCGHGERDLAVVGYDRWFARTDDYTYYRYRSCKLLALDPLPTVEEISTFYPPEYFTRLEGPRRNFDKRINQLAIRYYYGVDSRGRSRILRALFAALSGRVLAGTMPPHGCNRLLDIGCGTGATLDTYRRLGWHVAGIDRSSDAIALARGRGLRVHHGDVFDAAFGAEFDVVLLSHVIEHVRDPVAVLTRAATFVAEGGKVVVLTPNTRSLGFRLFGSCWFALEAPRHLMLFDRRNLSLLARKAGLAPARIITRSDPTVLSYSRDYARTQGHMLPAGLPARAACLQAAAEAQRSGRFYRNVITLPAWIAARCGYGEVIAADLIPSPP
jgi:2-polyprenyl-3-methyl-5-hydroxy-6-metoxy-1,4-benzoquinol methylase